MHSRFLQVAAIGGAIASLVAACSDALPPAPLNPAAKSLASLALSGSGGFQFDPLASSAVCTAGGNPTAPFIVPPGYVQTIVASEPQVPDAIDMNTQNETGKFAGRYLYRPAEGSNPTVTVTDLETGITKPLAFRGSDRLDAVGYIARRGGGDRRGAARPAVSTGGRRPDVRDLPQPERPNRCRFRRCTAGVRRQGA